LRFVRGKGKRWVLAVWAVVLLLMPFMIGAGMWFVFSRVQGPSPGNYGSVSTSALLQTHLPQRIDEPWVWDELENRIRAGTLTPAEADQALQAFTQYLQTQTPRSSHISWQRDYLRDAQAAGLLSDQALTAFSDAFFGATPRVEPLPRMREGSRDVRFELAYGTPWSGTELPWQLDWELVEVRLDGKEVKEFRVNHQHRDDLSGMVKLDLTPGEHEMTFVVEAVYLDGQAVRGVDLDSVPIANWPSPKKRWRHEVKAPLRVYTRDEPIVEPVSDAALSPASMVQIEQLAVQPARQGVQVQAEVRFDPSPPVPVSFDIEIDTGDRRSRVGSVAYWTRPGGGSSRRTSGARRLAGLPATVRRVNVWLVPNASLIESEPSVERVWGEPILIEDVELKRFDLPAE